MIEYAPGDIEIQVMQAAADIHEVELKDNSTVEKLLRQRVISVDRGEESPRRMTDDRKDPPERKKPKSDKS